MCTRFCCALLYHGYMINSHGYDIDSHISRGYYIRNPKRRGSFIRTEVTLQWRHDGRDGVSNHQPHHCLLNRFFQAQIKENIKVPRHAHLYGEFTSDRCIFCTKSLQRGKCFHLMTSSWIVYYHPSVNDMTTSSNGNIFRVTGPLWEECTGHRWIPLTETSDAELWYFLWCAPDQMFEQTMLRLVIWDAIAPIMMSLQCRLRAMALIVTSL